MKLFYGYNESSVQQLNTLRHHRGLHIYHDDSKWQDSIAHYYKIMGGVLSELLTGTKR